MLAPLAEQQTRLSQEQVPARASRCESGEGYQRLNAGYDYIYGKKHVVATHSSAIYVAVA